MNGFAFEEDNVDFGKQKIIEAILFHALDFGLIDKSNEAAVREFLEGRIHDDSNFVMQRQLWEEKKTSRDKFVYVCVLAGMRPTELEPWCRQDVDTD